MGNRILLLMLFLPALLFAQGSGYTLTFNGSNEAINIGNNVANNCRTIELWFKPANNINSGLSNPISLIVRDFNSGNGQSTNEFGLCFYPSLWGNPGKIAFFRRVGSVQHVIYSNQNQWTANHWYHVAITIDPVTGMSMYINGVKQLSTQPSTNAIGTMSGGATDNVCIGKWGNLNIRYFEGEIDEVRFWDVARSESEIRQKMCSKLQGTETGLKGYYDFNSSSASQLFDGSSNGYDGSLINMDTTNRIYSGAPIGDTSTYIYNTVSLAGQSLSLTNNSGEILSVDSINSVSKGVHIYSENAQPNSLLNLVNPNSAYFGVFLTSISGGFNMEYDLSPTACYADIFSRNDNAIMPWNNLNGTVSNCSFQFSNQSTVGADYRAEYILTYSSSLYLGNDTTLCIGQSFTLDATIIGATYLWQDGSTDSTYNVTQPGTYWVEVTELGNVYSDTINVFYAAIPIVDLGPDTTLCEGDSLLLDATFSNATYLWQDSSTDSVYNVTVQGTYWVEVDNNGCSSFDTINVYFTPLPNAYLGNDTTLCDGESIVLQDTNLSVTHLWQDGTTNPTLSVTQQGTYWVQIAQNGCFGSDTIVVDYSSIPILELGPDTSICSGQSLLLNATNTNTTYIWQDNSTDSIYNVTTQGTYWVEVDNNGCSSSDTINVYFNPLPIAYLGNDTTLCDGESILLQDTNLSVTYLWQDGTTNPTLSATQQGTYWVQIAQNGCFGSDTIVVDYSSIPILELGPDTSICSGQSLLLNATNTNTTYIWQDNSTDSIYNVTTQGTYWVEVDNNGCSSSDTINVYFNPLPIAYLGNDTTLCDGESILLQDTNLSVTYLWQDGTTNPTLSATQQGTYWVQIAQNGCFGSDTIVVDYSSIPILELGPDTSICSGQSLLLDATNINTTYIWQDNSTNASFSASQQGTYWVQVNNDGCIASDTIHLSLLPLPEIDLGQDTSACSGFSIILDATIQNASYLWQDNSTNATLTITDDGNYWVEVNLNGCLSSDTINIEALPVAILELGNDTVLCSDRNLMLSASYPNSTYLWQDNSTNANFNVTEEGTYWVEVNLNGCISKDSIHIGFTPAPNISLGNDTLLCIGQSMVLDVNYSDATYTWQDNSTAANFTVKAEGIYWSRIDYRGCITSDTIKVDYFLLPLFDLGEDTSVCFSQSIILNATTEGADYLWQDSSTQSVFEVKKNGFYWVEITKNGCSISDSVYVDSCVNIYDACLNSMVIPNVITPNNDGLNDVFTPIDYDCVLFMKTLIYSRWGQLVFESYSPSIDWNGERPDGDLVSSGTYFWVITYTNLYGIERTISGDLTVIR